MKKSDLLLLFTQLYTDEPKLFLFCKVLILHALVTIDPSQYPFFLKYIINQSHILQFGVLLLMRN